MGQQQLPSDCEAASIRLKNCYIEDKNEKSLFTEGSDVWLLGRLDLPPQDLYERIKCLHCLGPC